MTLSYRADHVGSLLRPKALLDARNNPDIKVTCLVVDARKVWKDA